MGKYYAYFFFLILGTNGFSQEIQVFRVGDFDLQGNVESCLVITDYGKELFEFNEAGWLTKTVTQYNETDQDITYYKYVQNELVEKRMESYKNNELDVSTSMANFYTLDTIPNKSISEKIISYDKEFLETQVYEYDETDRLVRIITSHTDGVDEIILEHVVIENDTIVNYFVNGVIEKSVRTSKKEVSEGFHTSTLTKEYVDGEPNSAVETVVGSNGKLISKETFHYDIAQAKFIPDEKKTNFYNEEDILEKVVSKNGNTESLKEYIFQFDSNPDKNWIKQIIIPDNTYTTRRISYYPKPEPSEEGQENEN